MTINQRFKLVRKELGFTQKEFAEKLNNKQTNISYIEKGIFPNNEIMELLHIKFNVNMNWLITGEGNMFSKKEYSNINEEFKYVVNEGNIL